MNEARLKALELAIAAHSSGCVCGSVTDTADAFFTFLVKSSAIVSTLKVEIDTSDLEATMRRLRQGAVGLAP